MAAARSWKTGFRVSVLQGVLPIRREQIPVELVSGITLAALAVPEVMGYTKIAGTPVITGLAVFLFLARVVRLGFMADFLSRTVLVGFLTGVGLQVALGQLSGMLGLGRRFSAFPSGRPVRRRSGRQRPTARIRACTPTVW